MTPVISRHIAHRWQALAWLVIAGAMAGLGAIVFLHPQHHLLPVNVISEANFNPLAPSGKNAFTVDSSSAKYDAANKLLSFNVHAFSTQVTFTEQAYPDILIYDKLVGTLNEYQEIQAKPGVVTLTRPKQLNGSQTAVMHTDSILLFAKPARDLSAAQWTELFNSLEPVS